MLSFMMQVFPPTGLCSLTGGMFHLAGIQDLYEDGGRWSPVVHLQKIHRLLPASRNGSVKCVLYNRLLHSPQHDLYHASQIGSI